MLSLHSKFSWLAKLLSTVLQVKVWSYLRSRVCGSQVMQSKFTIFVLESIVAKLRNPSLIVLMFIVSYEWCGVSKLPSDDVVNLFCLNISCVFLVAFVLSVWFIAMPMDSGALLFPQFHHMTYHTPKNNKSFIDLSKLF